MNGIYLLLGSNLNDRKNNLIKAINLLKNSGINVLKSSGIYETEPWGVSDQPWFLNIVVKVETKVSPQNLLSICLEAEKSMGRQRIKKWGERLIDIDILYYGDKIVDTKNLKIPHPEIQNRKFTLLPLIELAKNEKHPITGLTQQELYNKCEDTLICHRTFTEL